MQIARKTKKKNPLLSVLTFVILPLSIVAAVWFVAEGNADLTTYSWDASVFGGENKLEDVNASPNNEQSNNHNTLNLEKTGGLCQHEVACQPGKNPIRKISWQSDHLAEINEDQNQWISVPLPQQVASQLVQPPPSTTASFSFRIRNPLVDKYISGTIAKGGVHGPGIRDLLFRQLLLDNKESTDPPPVFVDCGANIGWFTSTALAIGARTISFEPFLGNVAVLQSTIRKNEWMNRSSLYFNAVSDESNQVTMESTHKEKNLSNMYITGSSCRNEDKPLNGTYGLDYMDAVSVDQVMMTHHRDIQRVNLMKIDVESHEIQVFNGAMRFFCNWIVEVIVVETLYLKPREGEKPPCDYEALVNRMIQMGYSVMDPALKRSYEQMKLADYPTADTAFVLKDRTQTPAQRLRQTENNPCAGFEL